MSQMDGMDDGKLHDWEKGLRSLPSGIKAEAQRYQKAYLPFWKSSRAEGTFTIPWFWWLLLMLTFLFTPDD